ncbi:MAG: TonB-dependent receptor, partial [Hyphomicrobiales bacterium]
MGYKSTRSVYFWLLSATFLSTVPATASLAQDAQSNDPAGAAERVTEPNDIVVTGSRIIRNGYNSPTPITVATTEQLIKAAPTNLPDALNQLPQFLNSGGPTRGNPQTVNSGAHGNLLNLRGVGPQRTLILMDGMRLPPTTYGGSVDTNIVPQLLIQRVDIVTAGVSAVYGSDAVAGVVNFVLDEKFEGLRAVGQQGITSRGDGRNYRLGVAGGFALGERARLLLSLERYKSKGFSTDARPKNHGPYFAIGSTGVGAPGSATNPFKIASDVHWLLGTEGGVALSGPFALTNFVAPGSYRPINLGTPTGTPNFFIGGDAFAAPPGQTAARDLTTEQAFARLTYDLTGDVKAYAQFIGSQTRTSYVTLPNNAFYSTIFSGNAFLPAELQARLTATNTPGFAFSHIYSAEGNTPARERTRFYMGAVGLQGQIDSKFSWDLSYNYGHSQHIVKQDNSWEARRYAAAIDAVDEGVFNSGTANGNIVCRVTLTNPDVFPGCVPFNPFGPGASSPQARAFVDQGTPEYRAVISQHNVEGAISGELFELWAGPVSTSVGASYRRSKLTLAGNGDPSVNYNVPGVRGIPATQTRWMGTLNVGHAFGSQSVKEAFAEVVIPLLKDVPLVQSLDISGAARFTDYKTSGSVWTWKVGGTWRPIDDILFRATYSRDIRAPTLFDLYAGQSSALA